MTKSVDYTTQGFDPDALQRIEEPTPDAPERMFPEISPEHARRILAQPRPAEIVLDPDVEPIW